MKKLKFLLVALALISGIGGAFATNMQGDPCDLTGIELYREAYTPNGTPPNPSDPRFIGVKGVDVECFNTGLCGHVYFEGMWYECVGEPTPIK